MILASSRSKTRSKSRCRSSADEVPAWSRWWFQALLALFLLEPLCSRTTVLTETLQWQNNSRIDDYTVTRATLGGNAPPLPNEYRDYTYNNDRGRLTSETFGPSSSQSTINYEFDEGSSAGIGIRTQAQLTGGGYLVDASTVNAFARTTLESTDAEPKTFTATGNAFGAGEVELTLLSSTKVLADFPGWEDATGDWSADLTLPAGSFTLKAEAIHPSGWRAPPVTRNFSVATTTQNLTSAHDADGNTTTRSFSASGRVQSLTWDGLGRLIQVEERNGSNDGYDWSARYDGLNRRLTTSYQKISANLSSPGSHLLTTKSSFDPQVEFLEIGLTVNREPTTDNSYWKIYGPDLNESFGGLQGIGGLEAVYDGGETIGLVTDHIGHVTARTDGTVVTWSDASLSGYGPLPGSWASSIHQSGDLATSVTWQGRYIDPTGYFCVGARYYEPNSGRFISSDPLGHEASMDLYSYANGDPINMADPDGRFASGIYNGVGNNGNIGISSPSSDSFYTGNIIGAAFGGYYEGLGGGASITANTYTFGGSDYLGLTNSSQYQGAAYDFSRISSTIARETTITVATLGAGTVVQAGRGGFALNSAYNLGRGYEAFNAGYDLTNSGFDAYNGNYGSAALNLTTGTLGAVGGFGRVDAPSNVRPGQTMSSYPQGRRVGGRGESPRPTDPPAGFRESGAWDPTPENLALMERGRPPVGRDDLPVELHHRGQNPAGPLDQMTSTTHDGIPHPLSPSQINRNQFAGERTRYWRGEARRLHGQE